MTITDIDREIRILKARVQLLQAQRAKLVAAKPKAPATKPAVKKKTAKRTPKA